MHRWACTQQQVCSLMTHACVFWLDEASIAFNICVCVVPPLTVHKFSQNRWEGAQPACPSKLILPWSPSKDANAMNQIGFFQHNDRTNELVICSLRYVLAFEGVEKSLYLPLMKPMPQILSVLPRLPLWSFHGLQAHFSPIFIIKKSGEARFAPFLCTESAFHRRINQQHRDNYS